MKDELRRLGEFGLIARLAKLCPTTSPQVRLGVGDDAAIVRPRPNTELLVTTDVLVEGVDFERGNTPFDRLGEKALAANLSDIAAMGGRPTVFFVSLSLPARASVREAEALYRGLGRCAKRYNVALGGGDMSSAPCWSVAVTVLGEVARGRALTRAGARAGDLLCVTGTLGDSGAGLALLQRRGRLPRGLVRSHARRLIDRHQLPTARLIVGQQLAAHRLATAAIDLSDGLAADVRHLCEASNVGVEIDLPALPISTALRRYAETVGHDPIRFALGGGEDFELLVTIPPENLARAQRLAADDTPLTVIGRVTPARRGLVMIDGAGRRRPLSVAGYEHFRVLKR
ncbi:MAG: thiamine-phosphate kinase [Nitrospirota bacterium]